MASPGNWFYSELRALKLAKRVISGASDVTLRVGSASDDFVVDAVVEIDDITDDITITLPDGEAIGQEVFITFTSDANSKDATISVTHHDEADAGTEPLDAVDEFMWFKWTGTEWTTIGYSTAADIA